MQRYASLDSCDGLSHRCHTCTRIWQYEGSTYHRKPPCYLSQSLVTLQAKACGAWLLGMSHGSRCHRHRVVQCELFTVNSPKLSIFSPPRPTYCCPFTEPFDGSNRQSANRLDLQPILVDRNQLWFLVPASLTTCCNRFAVDGHVANCDCVKVHLVRPPLSIIGVVARSVFSFTGDVVLWRFNWQTLVHSQLLAHRTSWMACRWSEMRTEKPWATMWCRHMCKAYEQNHVWGVSVYTTHRLRWIAIDCKRNQL